MSDTESESIDDFDFEDSSEMDTSDFTDGDDDDAEIKNELDKFAKNSAKVNIKRKINSARNWMVINIFFLIFVIALLGIFYGLGWMKFDSNFNESIN